MNPAVHNERVFGPSNPPATAVIRVFLAEDHHITLWGLRRLIEGAAPRMAVVGTASTREELLCHEAVALADVILLDLDLAGEDMAAAIDGLRPRCNGHVLVLTAADDADRQRAAVMRGARGVVHKSEPASTILRAIEKVSEGEVWLHRGLLSQVLGLLTSTHSGPSMRRLNPDGERIASLTGREREIVAALVRSAGAKLISVADELCMSENTLRNHLTSIYSKLCVRGRLELHVYATTHGLGGVTWGEKAPTRPGPSSPRDRVAISAA